VPPDSTPRFPMERFSSKIARIPVLFPG
jgi:hypothetical protein